MAPTLVLFDMTVYGRQESWEHSPDSWLRLFDEAVEAHTWHKDGRPIVQWSRLTAGQPAP